MNCAIIMMLTVAVGRYPQQRPTQMEQPGKIMDQDKDFSFNASQSCQTRHHHMAGFADPANSRGPYDTEVSLGYDGVSKDGRNTPTAAYVGHSPILQFDSYSYQP